MSYKKLKYLKFIKKITYKFKLQLKSTNLKKQNKKNKRLKLPVVIEFENKLINKLNPKF